MLTNSLNTDGYTGNILIEPNRPISWKANVRFIKLFALISLSIGLFFTYHGFLLVLPYSGLEVCLLAAALYLVYRHYTVCEVIYFTKDSVIIEFGDKEACKRIEYQRHWSAFHVDNEGRYNIPRLSILSRGKSTEIGAFLNYKDKLELITLIKTITSRFNALQVFNAD